MELYAIKLTKGLEQQLVYLPSSWLVSQGTSFSHHITEHAFDTLT